MIHSNNALPLTTELEAECKAALIKQYAMPQGIKIEEFRFSYAGRHLPDGKPPTHARATSIAGYYNGFRNILGARCELVDVSNATTVILSDVINNTR